VYQSLSEIILRTHVFWACSRISARIRSNFSANLIQNPTYQNESYFPLNCSILLGHCDRKTHLARFVAIGYPMAESVPQDIHTCWITFRTQMSDLNQLRIPRCVKLNAYQPILEVHGFCDASQRASEPVYTFAPSSVSTIITPSYCAQSLVTPLKIVTAIRAIGRLTINRLINKVRESLKLSQCPTYLWSDSTIALNWITSPSRRWSVFVANRVGEI